MSIFTSSGNTFPNQRPDEQTILITRKHWIRLFVPMFFIVLFALVPFVVYFFIKGADWYPGFAALYRFSSTVYFLILWNAAFYNIMIYTLNTIAVTTRRIVENEQRGFFRHNTDEIALKNIEDSSVRIFGLLATFLHYGNIEIQSAGATNIFHFKYLPHPQRIKKIIAEYVNYSKGRRYPYRP